MSKHATRVVRPGQPVRVPTRTLRLNMSPGNAVAPNIGGPCSKSAMRPARPARTADAGTPGLRR